ncbi:protein-tyrosine phosphatase family protein [Crossiella sp. CA-258035]|uniref:protein-tyrosine phosphatase family protein n=1 Tax=Crossiella sp. CA-258035 TaxID=2981138 RepID=UPI0024BC5E14|nr:protein-tyrosine phosphatase family protein [Crossiella sp. CA-258035]WHT15745.1 protein-tyrosine phosphatase family protein [Crossiella sp. CA-258035]
MLTAATTLPDGVIIRGRGLRNPAPGGPAPQFGLYLGGPKLRARHEHTLTWPHHWLDWPDFRLPRDQAEAITRIRALHAAAHTGQAVEVACNGGVGRTGTVIACLAILSGIPPTEAVAWARAHYHKRAVETPWQKRWVSRFPG